MPCLNVWRVSQASQLCDQHHTSLELCTTSNSSVFNNKCYSANNQRYVRVVSSDKVGKLHICPIRCLNDPRREQTCPLIVHSKIKPNGTVYGEISNKRITVQLFKCPFNIKQI